MLNHFTHVLSNLLQCSVKLHTGLVFVEVDIALRSDLFEVESLASNKRAGLSSFVIHPSMVCFVHR